MAKIIFASRSLIELEGRISDDCFSELIENVKKNEKTITVRRKYDEKKGITEIKLYPCKTYIITADDLHDDNRTYTALDDIKDEQRFAKSCERKIILKGSIPKSLQFTATYWLPFRKKAKEEGSNLRYVVLYPHRVFEENEEQCSEADYTEICLIIDGRCPEKERQDVLNRAAKYVCEKLRTITAEADPALMRSVHILDEISLDVVDFLNSYDNS